MADRSVRNSVGANGWLVSLVVASLQDPIDYSFKLSQ